MRADCSRPQSVFRVLEGDGGAAPRFPMYHADTCEDSFMEHLAKIAGGSNWRCVQLAAFTAYFDASGTEHDQPCMVVAGYLATAAQWVDFENEWVPRIRQDGLGCFHAADIERLIPDKGRRKELYIDLSEIISHNVTRQFGCCILSRAIQVVPEAKRKEWNMTAYSTAGYACASQVRLWFTSWHARSLPEFVFERGDLKPGALREAMEVNGFPAPIFKPKKDTLEKNGFITKGAVPLQAADLLAFELFDPMRKIERDGYLRRIRPAYQALDRIDGQPKAFTLEAMEHLYKVNLIGNDAIWVPDSPEDIPVLH